MKKKETRKRDLITVERFADMGFTDGYSGVKSREDYFMKEYANRNINSDEISKRILAYTLGYKKGKIISTVGIEKIKIKDNKVTYNNEIIDNSTYKVDEINNRIEELKLNNKKSKARRR